jgi:hypothetical protein
MLKHFVVLLVRLCFTLCSTLIRKTAYTFLCFKVPIYYGDSKEPIDMPRRNDLEHKALHLIANTGNQGVLQSEMWQKLDASSREGSRIAIKLENKGLIRRERELFGGRWTYRLYPNRKPASINSIADCPCLMCPDDPKCGAWSAISPSGCEKLTEWILSLVQKEMNPSGES